VVRRVVSRAGGNPFYASELVRAVVEQATDLADPLSVEQALARLPDTVHAAVLARLDLLPADERWALQLGAVLGRSFSAEGIAALGALGPAGVRETCRLLVERDLLRPAAADYAFRHILIREVAYQALPRSERARLHAAAAAWLEARAAGREDALAELVAFHYREAVALGGASADAAMRRRAVDWLARAAESAFAGAATLEGLGHLRAAIELAEPARQPDLYERLGEKVQSGTASDAPLRTALELSAQQGRPPDDQLRILGRLVMFAMRGQGSVATRMSAEAMAELRVRGRALLEGADPEGLATARFLAADAFYPFWNRGRTTDEEFAVAERDARRAADLAERHGDDDLLSGALDALSSVQMSRDKFVECLETSRRRVALGRRLAPLERLDAYAMVTWQSTSLGDLAGAEAASAEGLAQVQPGQEPAWTLHLVAWRLYALMLMGRWDSIGALALRARQLWEEMGRETAGYALRGFVAAAHVLASRGESAIAESMAEVSGAILQEYQGTQDVPGGIRWVFAPLLALDRAGVVQFLDHGQVRAPLPDALERGCAALSDHGWPMPDALTASLLERAVAASLRPLEAQLRRAIGLREADAAELERALAIAESCQAGSIVARLRYELARMREDEVAIESAIGALEAMGDRAQIARYRG
jgi:hypothetical protein